MAGGKLNKFSFPTHCASYSYLLTLSSLCSVSILLLVIIFFLLLREFPTLGESRG